MSGRAADLGLAGLGTMGGNLALNAADHGLSVVGWNREPGPARVLAEASGGRVRAAERLEQLVAALTRPRRVLLMVPAGTAVDQMLVRLSPLLQPGDVVIDGGNTHWRDTERRQRELAARGLHLLGLGVSGGGEGARHGASLMPGGDEHALSVCLPVLTALAAQGSDGACIAPLGPGGAGHFVKMVHNGIEYADMQLLAEAFDLLRKEGGLGADALADVFAGWHAGPLESFLTGLTVAVLRRRDEDGHPLVEAVLDQAGQKGTGRWALEEALQRGVPVPTVAAAVEARGLSSYGPLRAGVAAALAELRPPAGNAGNAGGAGHAGGAAKDGTHAPDVQALGRALHLARLLAYAQGFHLLAAASAGEGWALPLHEIARIWTGGCIIRARLLDDVRAAFLSHRELPHLLLAPFARPIVGTGDGALRQVVSRAAAHGVPVPALSASLAYLDGLSGGALPQSLTQAQRDAFGSHGYVRRDRPGEGKVHTDWLSAPTARA